MKKKILIIGGTGFLGFHLAKKCIKKNWDVTSISTHKPKKIRFLQDVKYLFVNIININQLKKIKLDYDYVVNFGGYVNHKERKKTFNSHYIGCKNLVDYFLNSKRLKLFIQIGSSVEYGASKSPQKENLKINIKKLGSTYGIAKLLATRYLIKKNLEVNFPCVILRPYLIFGPNQDFNRLIPIVIKSCIKNNNFPCSHGNQLRDFLYVDDFISAIFKCISNRNIVGEIFNIGTSKPLKVRDVISQIKNTVKKGHPNYGKLRMRDDEIINLFPNTGKIKKKLKWSTKVEFASGLNKTINYYKKIL